MLDLKCTLEPDMKDGPKSPQTSFDDDNNVYTLYQGLRHAKKRHRSLARLPEIFEGIGVFL